ncbi:MAG: nuclear transport factor 2 family protein, partial [Bacteroidota bacterium]
LFACLPILSFSIFNQNDPVDSEEIKKLIDASYFHGAFNELNPEAMAKGFHPDFAIFSPKGEDIRKYPIKDWVENTRKRKSDPEFDPKKNVWEGKVVKLDITGNSASAKIELRKDKQLIYTDYLSLLKFESGWKIVAKVYHKHP